MSNQLQIKAALATALVQSGTLAFSYPTGYNKADFNTFNAQLATDTGNLFTTANADFTLSLGDTSATLTFQAATSIPVSTEVILGLDLHGDQLFKDQNKSKRTIAKTIIRYTERVNLGTPGTAATTTVATTLVATTTAKSYAIADFTAAFKAAGGVLDVPRNLTITGSSSADHVVTITGKDIYGQTMIENITASSTATVVGLKAFSQVTGIAIAAGASAKTISIGTGVALGLPVMVKAWDNILRQVVDSEIIATNVKRYLEFAPAIVAANAGTSQFYPSPCYGFITKATVAVCAAFTTGGAVIPKIATVAVTGLSVAVSTGVAGTVYTDDATDPWGSTGEIAKDASIEIAGDAAFDSVGNYAGYLEIVPGGKLVVGSEAVPTATTGDIRGTWTPPTALTPNGSRTYILDILTSDPGYIGIEPFGS